MLSIIIVNYRSADYTRQCLRRIYEHGNNPLLEVFVIDNATYDGCGEMIQAEFPQVKFFQSEKNLGFAGANNVGVEKTSGEYVMFLNPDTEIEGNAIEDLLNAVRTMPRAGMAGARLLNSDRTVQTTSISAFPSIMNQLGGLNFLRRRFPNSKLWGIGPLFQELSSPVAVDAISGACMVAPRSVVEQVGAFTTKYFMYGEDLDLCLKVHQAGWKIYYVPMAVIVHHGGGSSDTRAERYYAEVMQREAMYQFMRRHRGAVYAAVFSALAAVAAMGRMMCAVVLLPAALSRSRRKSIARIWRKGAYLLGWNLGLHAWTKGDLAGTAQSR
jgi:GT2 family glycosyltransferase